MIVIDLSHTVAEDMPVYPGTEPPQLRPANTIETDGFAETLIRMYSHTGTHVDAPAHMLRGAQTLDELDAARFVGPACVIDVAGRTLVSREVLESHAALVDGCRFVLFHTGWAHYWGQPRYFEGFPVLSGEAARWLTGRGLSGVGVDAISVDPIDGAFGNHLELFKSGLLLIENLKGLDVLCHRRFQFTCLPLKLTRADGSPVRAAALLD